MEPMGIHYIGSSLYLYASLLYTINSKHVQLLLLGRVTLVAQRPIVVKLSLKDLSVGRSVCRSVQFTVEKRRIGSGCRLAP